MFCKGLCLLCRVCFCEICLVCTISLCLKHYGLVDVRDFVGG